MKHFVKILLVVLFMAVLTAGIAERKFFSDRNLTLQSPCAFFPGKYALNSVIDPNDNQTDADCNFIIYDFIAAEEITQEELLMDAARYRQALLNSGCFEKSQIAEWMLYTGDRKIALATTDGFTDDFHVSVYALDRCKIRIEMVNAFSFSDITSLSGNQKTEANQPSAADSKTIATNDGLTVLSPEQYLGIDPCDEIYRDDNHYTYAYTDRGYTYHGSGTANPVDWFRMEEYVNALVDSGYYEILEYSDDTEDAYWTLRYIGPAEVKNTFYLYYGRSDQAAITVRNFIGNIKVRYSIDILTADIADTQARLGENIIAPTNSGDANKGSWCSACGGSGNCSSCGGSGKVRNLVPGTTEWIYQGCLTCLYSGDCRQCGGDSVR